MWYMKKIFYLKKKTHIKLHNILNLKGSQQKPVYLQFLSCRIWCNLCLKNNIYKTNREMCWLLERHIFNTDCGCYVKKFHDIPIVYNDCLDLVQRNLWLMVSIIVSKMIGEKRLMISIIVSKMIGEKRH